MNELPKWPVGYGKKKRIMVPYPENPREGICDSCRRSVHRNDIKTTQLHHWKYAYKDRSLRKNPLLVLENLSEFCYSCLDEKTYMLVNAIPIQVTQMQTNDHILDSRGNTQKISECMKRWYEGDLVTIKGRGLLSFSVTPEHEILVSIRNVKTTTPRINGRKTTKRHYSFTEPLWIDARDVYIPESGRKIRNKRPFLIFPKYKPEEDYSINLRPYSKRRISDTTIPQTIKLTESLAELLGLYLAEGYPSLSKRPGGVVGVTSWCFGKHEHELIDRTVRLIRETLGKKAGISERRTAMVVYVCSVQLTKFLAEQFGTKAPNKKIPEFIMNARKNIVRAFIRGYLWGDGYEPVDGIHFTTSSLNITIQLQKLFSKLDIFAAVYKSKEPGTKEIEGRVVSTSGEYAISVNGYFFERWGGKLTSVLRPRYYGETEDCFYIPIKKIWRRPYEGYVYNFETPDHTYQVSNVVVHNCHQLGDSLRVLLRPSKERLTSVIAVGLLMPPDMKEKMDYIARSWIAARKRDKKTKISEYA